MPSQDFAEILADRFAHFRAKFRDLVRATVPAAALALGGCGDCPPDDEIHLIRNPDQATKQLIEACRSDVTQCISLCRYVREKSRSSQLIVHCELHMDADGYAQVHIRSDVECLGGRRCEGVALRPQGRTGTALGRYLAELAQLESASIPAFRHLARELAAHGAPAPLVRAARSAARDEIRHARLVAGLARRHGAEPQQPQPGKLEVRSLERIAIENAVEGCVNESFAALLATRQACVATDRPLRQAMVRIAEDETRHAALAWAIDDWCQQRLPTASRRRIRLARTRAVRRLRDGIAASGLRSALRRAVGLPTPDESRRLVIALENGLA